MDLIIVLSIITVILALLFFYGGLRETLGDFIIKILPKKHIQKGDQVDIFLNGEHNRTATISSISTERIVIYGSLPLPLDYRGRFYGIGVNTNDGSRLIYVGNRKHYRFVRMAEIIRKVFAVMDEAENLKATPEDENTVEVVESQESEVGDDK